MACYRRGGLELPITGTLGAMISALQLESDLVTLWNMLVHAGNTTPGAQVSGETHAYRCMQALEGMLAEGWVLGSVNRKRPMMELTDHQGLTIRSKKDVTAALKDARGTVRFDDPAPGAT